VCSSTFTGYSGFSRFSDSVVDWRVSQAHSGQRSAVSVQPWTRQGCAARSNTSSLTAEGCPLMARPYYGWVLVVTLAVTAPTSWGVLYYAFAVFLAPMQESFGWSRAAMTGAFSVALLLSGLAGVPAGRWLDRHGPRALMAVGSVAAALLVLAWAAVRNLAMLYLVWAGIGVTMAAVLYEPAF